MQPVFRATLCAQQFRAQGAMMRVESREAQGARTNSVAQDYFDSRGVLHHHRDTTSRCGQKWRRRRMCRTVRIGLAGEEMAQGFLLVRQLRYRAGCCMDIVVLFLMAGIAEY